MLSNIHVGQLLPDLLTNESDSVVFTFLSPLLSTPLTGFKLEDGDQDYSRSTLPSAPDLSPAELLVSKHRNNVDVQSVCQHGGLYGLTGLAC